MSTTDDSQQQGLKVEAESDDVFEFSAREKTLLVPKVAKPKKKMLRSGSASEAIGLVYEPCLKCRRKIFPTSKDRQILSSDKTMNWHESCFKCEGCSIALAWTGYFFHDGNVYCVKCMDEHCADICERCDQRIKIYCDAEVKQVTSVDGTKHWHEGCYNCVKCATSLLGRGYFTTGNMGGMFCANCYDEQEAETCIKCKFRILRCSQNEKQITSKDKRKHWHAKCYNCYRCKSSMVGVRHYLYEDGCLYCAFCYDEIASKICAKCKERIYRCSKSEHQIMFKSDEVVLYWHERCYKCFKCDKSLAGQGHYWHTDSEMYCGSCYDEFTANKCARCNKLIYRCGLGETQIASKDRTKFWHIHCYQCWFCHKALVGQRIFYYGEYNNMCCATCYDEKAGKTCSLCRSLIYKYSRQEKQISYKDGTEEAMYWHDYCYLCSKCKVSLVRKGHYPHSDGNTYCGTCYDEIVALTCAKCKKIIYRCSKNEKPLLSNKDKSKRWHQRCYTCSRCRRELTGQACYARSETSLFCSKCARANGFYVPNAAPKAIQTSA